MKRAREYRIGNYVTVRGVIQYIIGIESNNDWNVEDGLGAFETIRTNVNPMNMSKDGLLYVSEVEPIPLTEDALLSFGFVSMPETKDEFRFTDNDEGFRLEVSEYFIKDGRAVFYYNKPYKNQNHTCIAYCKYVHQLQNLYHALSGKELTTKNDTI